MEAGDKRVRPPASRYPNGPSDNPKVPLRVVGNHEKFAGYGGGGRGYICTPLHRKLATPWQFIRPRSDITTHGAFLELVLLPSVSFSLTLPQHVRQPPDSSYYSSLTHQKPVLPTMEEDSEEAIEESFSTKPWAANNCQNAGVSLGVTWCAPRLNCDSSAGSATAFRHLDKHLGSFRCDKSPPPEGLLSVFSYLGRPAVILLPCNPTVTTRR